MILTKIVSKLRDFVSGIQHKVDEVREKLEERRAASLAEKLTELAKGTPYTDWQNSITDLVYLVGEDGSYEGRKELWSDLGFTEKYTGSAEQNIALHKRFLEELPRHGIPWPKTAS